MTRRLARASRRRNRALLAEAAAAPRVASVAMAFALSLGEADFLKAEVSR